MVHDADSKKNCFHITYPLVLIGTPAFTFCNYSRGRTASASELDQEQIPLPPQISPTNKNLGGSLCSATMCLVRGVNR